MRRNVMPEILDELAPSNPLAVASRSDLRRLNSLMGSADFIADAISRHCAKGSSPSKFLRLAELGGGDGTLLLSVARRLSADGIRASAILLDRRNLVSPETRDAFSKLDWTVETVEADVFDWLEKASPVFDVMLANLFLHHFADNLLTALLRLAAGKADFFMACEPGRNVLSLTASRLLWFIRCNSVTRHDAVASVRAGFSGGELSALWPAPHGWELSEHSAGLFSHCLVAKRNG